MRAYVRRPVTSVPLALLLPVALAGSLGCAGPAPKQAQEPARIERNAPPPAAGTAARADALTRRAERDVEAALALRDGERPDAPEEPGGATTASVATAPASSNSPRILWNESAAGRAARPPEPKRAPETAPKASIPPAPSALATDTPGITIEPPPAAEPAPEAAGDAVPENVEPGGAEPEELRTLLVDVRRELNLQKPWSNQPLREMLAMAMLTLIDPDLTINPEAFVDVTDAERKIVADFQQFCLDLRARLDGSTDAEQAIAEAVMELRRALVREPELKLPTVALCWRVGGFGDYDEFQRASFLAHAEQRFILYLEIESFTSELNKKNQWVTEVSQQWEIYHAEDGIPVWSEPWQKAVDVTNKERRDFFTTQIVTIPKALSVGSYLFKIRVRDEKSGAQVERSLPMEVVADPKLAVAVPEK